MITKTAKEIGYKDTHKYGWVACVDCGKERWVMLRKGIPISPRCKSCAAIGNGKGEGHPAWKGGRVIHNGYIINYLYPEDPFYPMANHQGYILEHRLVMAKYLGRLLEPKEVVHHNGTLYPMGSFEDRQDNRIENLRLFPNDSAHRAYHRGIRGG